MANTQIIPPRVPFIDERTGLIAREWYLFLLSLFGDSTTLQDEVAALQVESAFAGVDDGTAAEDALRLASMGDTDTGRIERQARDAYLLGMMVLDE